MKSQAKTGESNPKNIKVRLAKEIVARYHSEEASEHAAQEFDNVFKKKNVPDNIPEAETWGDEARWICKVLTEHSLTESTSAAIRLIKQGAVTVNGQKVLDKDHQLEGNQEHLIKVGKKRFLKITAN